MRLLWVSDILLLFEECEEVSMGGVVIERKVRKKIRNIFEHPDDVYSVYLVNSEDAVWVHGKGELYKFLHSLKEESRK